MEIRGKKGRENMVADLSRLKLIEKIDKTNIIEVFPNEQIFTFSLVAWYR